MHKYGIALAEVSEENLKKFDVISIPRIDMFTLVIDYSEPFQDGNGQIDRVPTRWANGWIVEAADWTQEHTDIIENAREAFNLKHLVNPIPANQLLIWDGGQFPQLPPAD